MTIVNLGTEDEISEVVATKLVISIVPGGIVGLKLRKGGFGYLKANLFKFRSMAQREHVFILSDLDRRSCAAQMRADWEGSEVFPDKLIFRIPVREIESWLLADRRGMAELLGVSEAKLPADPDNLADPKQALLGAAKMARRNIRSELLVTRGSVSSQGIGYNRILSDYARSMWQIDRACERSPSLNRAVARLAKLV